MSESSITTTVDPNDPVGCFIPHIPPSTSDPSDTMWIHHLINTVLIPIVCVPGVFAASICVIVFTRPKMVSSLNIYLAGLSFFDLLLLTMSLFIYPPMSICMRTGNDFICHFFWRSALVTFPISLVSQTASVWTCVAVTVDRYLAVQYPLKTRVLCTSFKALCVLLTIGTISLLYKMPSVFELRLDECGRLLATELRQNELYIMIYNTYGYLLFLIVIPWTLMIILNVTVVRAVHTAYRKRQSLVEGNMKVDDKERRCTIMALVMISTFIVCQLLAGVNHVLEAFDYFPNYYRLRIPIGNLMVCVNSASNILIYSIFGRRFRRTAVKLLCPCLNKSDYLWLAQLGVSEHDYRKTSYASRRGSSLHSMRKGEIERQRRQTEAFSLMSSSPNSPVEVLK
ncbi:G-PROTEIN-RECEP-F1-2 domain-containing protein [Aphelenchoides besseyi]|nr:G-PROTEIN-RECEP-F1-2 domain-containing protein [Aphelenchoides besseyi]KAI6211741.1 G-PROTEIN-RECEP-F1-2 domain-containing protein [Aphelenchoides besseyi]